MKCRAIVSHFRLGLIKCECKRNAIKDGFCWQHHPEYVKKKEKHAEMKLEATPFYLT